MRSLALAVLLCASAASAGPLAELWPYEAKRVDATTVEYRYDLTALKVSGGSADAKAEHGEEAVAAFLKSLPKDVKLKVKLQAPLYLSAARGLEQAPLATSFGAVSDGALASDDPLRRKPKSRVRAALDPDEPKLLPAAELVMWRTRRLEDGALAAVALDTDRLMKAWLQQLSAQAIARSKNADGGDTRDGALLLAARAAAALACLEPNRLQAPAAVAADAKQQLAELRADESLFAPRGFWEWTDELQCAWRRWQALGVAFPPSRAGYAAGFVMLSILKEPKLKSTWLKLRGRRDTLFGGPKLEPLQDYLEKAGGDPDAALEDLLPVIDRHGAPPPPMAPPRAPFGEFLSGLQGAERAQAVDELAAAVADGRVALPKETTAPVEALRQSALGAFSIAEQPKGLQFDAAWRDRFSAAFCALQGAHHESRESNIEPSTKEVVRTELRVVLEAPPWLEVEPLPEAFKRGSDSSARLASALAAEGLSSLSTVDPEGQGGLNAVNELKKWQSVLAGLAVISARDAFETPDVANARKFLAGWRSDPLLARDVRFSSSHPISFEGERTHAVVAGVARRELAVQFAEPPQAEIVGGVPGIAVDLKAEQRYLVPVLFTLSYRAPAAKPSLKYTAVRKAIDEAKRDPLQIPAALPK